jgi:hypothetical protein
MFAPSSSNEARACFKSQTSGHRYDPSPLSRARTPLPARRCQIRSSATVFVGHLSDAVAARGSAGREALKRADTFFTSPAANIDLKLLIDLRDGVVHAAFDEAVEERLLVALRTPVEIPTR